MEATSWLTKIVSKKIPLVNVEEIVVWGREPSPDKSVEDGSRHLEASFETSNENFTVYVTNKTDEHLQYVALHLELTTRDERHTYYSRRPLYRPESESRAFGLTDDLEPRERETEFHVNTGAGIPSDVNGAFFPDNDSNQLFERWAGRRRRYLYLFPHIAYRFEGGDERYHVLYDEVEKVQVAPAIKHKNLSEVLEYEASLGRRAHASGALPPAMLDAIRSHPVGDDGGGIGLGLVERHFPRGDERKH